MSTQVSHWRVASAAVVFVLAGSSAVVIAMHTAPSGAYQANAVRASRRNPASASAAERSGRALLAQAVAACRSTAFSGVQVFRYFGPAGPRVWRTEIWHRPGGQTEAVPVADGDGPAGQADTESGPSVSVALSSRQLTLLQSSYVLDYTGAGVADGRAAELVTVDRPDGTVAAKYWLDDKTRLPLRRQLFDDHTKLVSDISVAGLRTGKGALTGMPAGGSQPWPSQLDLAALTALRSAGLAAAGPAARRNGAVRGQLDRRGDRRGRRRVLLRRPVGYLAFRAARQPFVADAGLAAGFHGRARRLRGRHRRPDHRLVRRRLRVYPPGGRPGSRR